MCNTNPVFPDVPFVPFGSDNLLHEGLREALVAEELDRLVVTTDCPRVAHYAATNFPSVEVLERAPHLRGHDTEMAEVLREVATRLQLSPEALLCVLSLHTPFRRSEHIADGVNTFVLYDVDSVVSVYEERNPVYQLGARGLEPVYRGMQYALRRERDVIYVDNSAVRVFPAGNLREPNFLGTRIGHVVMAREDSFKINVPSDVAKLGEGDTSVKVRG